ncbi:hypothetical protein CRUP_004177, partial [Coryphaenoides rupestris]
MQQEHLFKILVIGDLGVGKTSIIRRYVHQIFSQHYRATIGVDFALKVLQWDSSTVVRLQLWDIAGQERYGNMTRVYYREAVGALVVFDVSRGSTFEAVLKWKDDLDSKVKPVMLLLWLPHKPPWQERYGNMTRVYYREAVGALVVFDVSRGSTFEAVLKWKDDLDSKGRPVPAVLLANKSDQAAVHYPKLDSFCKDNAFVAWFETSAK